MPAEPVHDEPTDFRGAISHQLHANLAAVGGLADLSDLARKLQPDLIPTNVTVNEDTVCALLRVVIALTLVPAPWEVTMVPKAPPPQPTPQPTEEELKAQRRLQRTAEIAARKAATPSPQRAAPLRRHNSSALARCAPPLC